MPFSMSQASLPSFEIVSMRFRPFSTKLRLMQRPKKSIPSGASSYASVSEHVPSRSSGTVVGIESKTTS